MCLFDFSWVLCLWENAHVRSRKRCSQYDLKQFDGHVRYVVALFFWNIEKCSLSTMQEHLDSVLYSMRACAVTVCEAGDRARSWRIQGSTWQAFRGMLINCWIKQSMHDRLLYTGITCCHCPDIDVVLIGLSGLQGLDFPYKWLQVTAAKSKGLGRVLCWDFQCFETKTCIDLTPCYTMLHHVTPCYTLICGLPRIQCNLVVKHLLCTRRVVWAFVVRVIPQHKVQDISFQELPSTWNVTECARSVGLVAASCWGGGRSRGALMFCCGWRIKSFGRWMSSCTRPDVGATISNRESGYNEYSYKRRHTHLQYSTIIYTFHLLFMVAIMFACSIHGAASSPCGHLTDAPIFSKRFVYIVLQHIVYIVCLHSQYIVST